MKHNVQVTLLLLAIFFAAQVIGLGLLALDSDVKIEDGKTVLEYDDTFIGERPDVQGFGSFLYLVLGVGIGTFLLLLIIKYKKFNIWKLWFWLASFLAMALALEVLMSFAAAALVSFVLAYYKIFKPNVYLHNVTEVLIYSGLAIFLVPMLDLFWGIALLIAFSAYDAYAVWKSKHMVKMAEFQSQSNMFAGLNINYKDDDAKQIKVIKKTSKVSSAKTKLRKAKTKSAILGGGDIAFPLLFAGVVMNDLILDGVSKALAFGQSLIIVIASTFALAYLFYTAEKDKFYPAMPFLTVGCFIGLAVVVLI